MANAVTDSLLRAIRSTVDGAISNLSNDITVKATIIECTNASINEYSASYNGGQINVYSQDGSSYQTGETVYVLVPMSDFGNKKYIIGRASNGDIIQENNGVANSSKILADYNVIGKNANLSGTFQNDTTSPFPVTLNPNKVSDWVVCYDFTDTDIPTINHRRISLDSKNLTRNMKNSDGLLIRAKFTTDLSAKARGNYGIKIIANVTLEDGSTASVPYSLDTSVMKGDPMRYYSGMTQHLICDFSKYKFNYIENIICFSQGFTDKETTDLGSIKINNLEIYALSSIGSSGGEYVLSLMTPFGNILDDNSDKVEITAKVYNLGVDITSSATIYWGVEDFTVGTLHAEYNSKLGSGFKYLPEFDNYESITVDSANSPSKENKYKCVAVCNGDVLLEREVYIFNDMNQHEISFNIKNVENGIYYPANGKITITCLVNGKASGFIDSIANDEEFSFIWAKSDSYNGAYIFNKTLADLEIEEQEALQASETEAEKSSIRAQYTTLKAMVQGYDFKKGVSGNILVVPPRDAKYKCTVKRNGAEIGRAEVDLRSAETSLSQKTYITIKNGNQYFQYNEQGISPASVRMKEPVQVLFPAIEFRNPDNAEIIDNENILDCCYWDFPKENTLIEGPTENLTDEGWYHGQTFPLKIAEIYDVNKTNNQLIAIVKWEGTTYRANTNLNFSKIGEVGTNGTSFSARIVPNFEPDNYKAKLTIIEDNTLHWNAKAEDGKYLPVLNSLDTPFKSQLYLNNELQSGYTTSWSLHGGWKIPSEDRPNGYIMPTEGRTYTIDSQNGRISLTQGSSAAADFRTIKARNSFNKNYYYAYYNLPMIKYFGDKKYEDTPIDIIDAETLNYVTYNEDDCSPSYNMNMGVTIEVDEQLYKTSKFTWIAESGAETESGYQNPNFLLSFNQGSSTGGRSLHLDNVNSTFEDFSNMIDTIAKDDESGKAAEIQKYLANLFFANYDASTLVDNINQYLRVIEKQYCIGPSGEWTNSNIKDIHDQYVSLVNQIVAEQRKIAHANIQLNNHRKHFYSIANNGNWKGKSLSEVADIFPGSYYGNSAEGSIRIQTYGKLIQCMRYDIERIYYKETLESDGVNISQEELQSKIFNSLFGPYENSILNKLENEIELIGKDSEPQFLEIFKNQKAFYSDAYSRLKDKITNLAEETINSDQIGNFENNIDILMNMVLKLFAQNSELNSIDTNQISVINNCAKILKENIGEEEKNKVKLTVYIIPNDTFSSAYANNNVKILIQSFDNSKIAEVVVPICFMTNTYSLSSLNDWDGTGIRINEEEGYILSPQIGAGVKNNVEGNNTFTGIVMGSLSNPDQDGKYTPDKIGLMGFFDGRQSIFLDSRTGSATFGLKDGTDMDGCIELIPGGTSKIANWNIGKNLLYNCGTGLLEKRRDTDARIGNSQKNMIQKNDYGILLSSDMPYIHIKGKTFDADYIGRQSSRSVNNIENINVGDSLELRLDPDNNSLFSIWQHTDGFSVEQDGMYAERMHYGTYVKNAQEKRVSELDLNSKDLDSNKVYTTYLIADPQESYYTFGNNLIQYDAGNMYTINPIENDFDLHWNLNPIAKVIPTSGVIEIAGCKLDSSGVNYILPEGFSQIQEEDSEGFSQWKGKIQGTVSCDPGVESFNIDVCTMQSEDKTQHGYEYSDDRNNLIKLYSFKLMSETPILSINQSLDFSGIMSDANLRWRFIIKDGEFTIAKTEIYSSENEYNNQIIFGENNFVGGKTKFEPAELTMYLELWSDEKTYKYEARVNTEINATTGYLPDVDWPLLYSDIIGKYTQMYGSEVNVVASSSEGIEFKYTTGYFEESNGSSYKITNTSGTTKFTIVFYSITTSTGTPNIGAIYVKNVGPQETVYFPVGAQVNSFYSWRYAIYQYQEELPTEAISISTNPKYSLKNIAFKLVNKEQLKINLGEPSNFNNLTPRDSNALSHLNDNEIEVIGYSLAETSVNTNDEPKITIKKNVFDKTGKIWSAIGKQIGDKVPFIDWFKNSDGNFIKCVRAFNRNEIEKYFETTDADLVLYPRNKDFETKYLSIEEYIKVGIDENGKFFTSGKNKGNNTSSRVGAIKIFDSCYGYGQEISSGHNQILKIGSSEDNVDKSTFITPGSNNTIKIVSDNSISLYLPNRNVQSVIEKVPTPYNGIEITQRGIVATIKGQTHTFTENDLETISNNLSVRRVQNEQRLFDDEVNYERLMKLLEKISFEKLETLIKNLSNIENTVKTGNPSTWTE